MARTRNLPDSTRADKGRTRDPEETTHRDPVPHFILQFLQLLFFQRFIESNLKPYTSCNLPHGPAVLETAPLDAAVTTRMVQNSGQDFYANVKVEILPAES